MKDLRMVHMVDIVGNDHDAQCFGGEMFCGEKATTIVNGFILESMPLCRKHAKEMKSFLDRKATRIEDYTHSRMENFQNN